MVAGIAGLMALAAGGAVDFVHDIAPVLTRAGCNAADCHGAALGQGGFKLSLFGEDPAADHHAITHELGGRRIDRAEPPLSLVARKPTRQLPHKGGRVLEPDGPGHRALLAWGAAGFPFRSNAAEVVRLEAHAGERLQVTACYSDGARRDVSELALYSSQDEAIAQVSPEGELRLLAPGETAIMVRFAGHVTSASVARPFGAAPSTATAATAAAGVGSIVDRAIDGRLARLGLPPSPPAGPADFARRAHLLLCGRLPSPQEVRGYLAAPDRLRLVEVLIASPDFDRYWTYRLGQLFEVSSKRMGAAAGPFFAWLGSRVRRPWSETARLVLMAAGTGPETGFFRGGADPKALLERTGEVFLGTRWHCGQCHNHPFDRFPQEDYYGLAAFLARVREVDDAITDLDRGEVVSPRTGLAAAMRFPGGGAPEGSDRRGALAAWVTSQPQHRRAFANWVWAQLMGRGLVHPADDFRASNPPTHPELLDELARLETIPELVRAIASSAAFARGGPIEANRADDRFASCWRERLLDAEVLLDAIARATGEPHRFEGRPPGTLAIALGDGSYPSPALDVCGRGKRGFGGSVAQELHLLVGSEIESRLAVARELTILNDDQLIEELSLRALSRPPSAAENERWTQAFALGPREEIAEDLLWALLNSWEFRTCQ